MTTNSANLLALLCVQYEDTRARQGKATGNDLAATTAELIRARNRLAQAVYRECVLGMEQRYYDCSRTGYRYTVDVTGELSRHLLLTKAGRPKTQRKFKRRQAA